MDVGKKGVRFKGVSRKIARFYMKKGYSKKRATEIGKKTAGKIFWRKFGKRRGKSILRRAKPGGR